MREEIEICGWVKAGFYALAREHPKASPLGKLAKIFDF